MGSENERDASDVTLGALYAKACVALTARARRIHNVANKVELIR